MTHATAENNSLQATPPASPASAGASRSLSDVIRAVNDHRREVEMRRMALAARASTPADDWPVPVPRARLLALEQQAREASVLRALLDSGPVIAVPFSAAPPHTLRDMPASLARTIGLDGEDDLHDRPLTRLFSPADAPRLQQALYGGDAATLVAHLHRADGRTLRVSVHLSARDAAQPDWRWACIVRLPQTAGTSPQQDRHLPPKSNQRPRIDVWPSPSA